MKRADIDDLHVLRLAQRYTVTFMGVGVVQALVDEGIPYNLALAKVQHLVSRRLLDYGTSPHSAWPTPEGESLLRSAPVGSPSTEQDGDTVD